MGKYFLATVGLFLICASLQAASPDSILVDRKLYTLHKVKAGETLYSISNHYSTELAEIVAVNRIGGSGYTLATGDILIIPLYAKKITAAVNEKVISQDGYITHIVRQGETLFSISRNYNGVTPQMIKEKNGLTGDGLNIGQKLQIPQQINVAAMYKTAAIDRNEIPAEIKPTKKESLSLEKQFSKVEKDIGGTEISRGIATWIDDDSDANTKNSYALHKYAPVGTVLKVRNLMNNRVVFVKVLGKLADNNDNKSILIKLSKAAAADLGVFDQKFLVEVMIPQA